MIKLSEDRYDSLCDAHTGLCRSCEAERECTEPDAENYTCEACGADDVFGCEQLLIMGELEIQ
jgi:hypothetical protein